MTAPGGEAPRPEYLPPSPIAPESNGAASSDAAEHALAAERAQAAAAARVHPWAAAEERAVPDYTGLVTRAIGSASTP